jgi:PiT family inorganic phosphate transporter
LEALLIVGVVLLSFANGANDNFKGVATLWGAGQTSYRRALAWATGFTLLGSMSALWLASGIVARFNGSKLLSPETYAQLPFLAAVALGAGATVLLASLLGLPISTTHALTGALAGSGVLAAGAANVKFTALGATVLLPLLFSPLAAFVLTIGVCPLLARAGILTGKRDCVCLDEPALAAVPAGADASLAALTIPAVRWAGGEECRTGAEVFRVRIGSALHWLSAAAISFARGLNDTPKIVAVLLVTSVGLARSNFLLVGLVMALGGLLAARRVAQTMSRRITPMTADEAVTANLVAAGLVVLASAVALPVSTTHVTSGSLFGIGLLRRSEADWKLVQEILLSWLATLPLAAALAACGFWILTN